MPLDGERSVALLKLPDMGSKLRLLPLYLNLLPDGHCGAAIVVFSFLGVEMDMSWKVLMHCPK